MPPIRDPLTGRFTRSDEPAEASSSTAEPAAADVEDIMRKFGLGHVCAVCILRVLEPGAAEEAIRFIGIARLERLCNSSDNSSDAAFLEMVTNERDTAKQRYPARAALQLLDLRGNAAWEALFKGLSKGAAFVLLLLLVSAVIQAAAILTAHLEDVKGKSGLYQAAKWVLLACQLVSLLDNWLSRALKWALLGQWPETHNVLKAYLGLAYVALYKVCLCCYPWTEPAVLE